MVGGSLGQRPGSIKMGGMVKSPELGPDSPPPSRHLSEEQPVLTLLLMPQVLPTLTWR